MRTGPPYLDPPSAAERVVDETVRAHGEQLRYAWRQRTFGLDGPRIWAEALAAVHRDVRGALARLTCDVEFLRDS